MTLPVPDPSGWWAGHISGPTIKTYLVDPINSLAGSSTTPPQGWLAENVSNTAVTLDSTAGHASAGHATFTLATSRRVRVDVTARFTTGTQPASFSAYAAVSTGGSANASSATQVGPVCYTAATVNGAGGANTVTASGTVVLAAGTYTAFAVVTRVSGGAATDSNGASSVLVTDMGAN